MSNKKMAIIGSGMMGTAIMSGIIQKGILAPQNIRAADADPEKPIALREKYGTIAATSNLEAIQGADIILISVKPQYLPEVLEEMKGKIPPGALVLSIVVGVPLERFTSGLAHSQIIRVMPNTPAQIGEGVSGWCASKEVTEEQREFAKSILSCLGLEIYFDKESALDIVGAISGSGPAYVCLFAEAMIDSAVQLGMPRKTAEKVVLQTIEGSARYIAARGEHPAVLKNEVTSPGGTTAEALYQMEKEGLRNAVAAGILGAYKRTVEIFAK